MRLSRHAAVRAHGPWSGRSAGRDDGVQVPASAGKHGLADRLFAAVGEHLKRHGIKLPQATIVDATIIASPPSMKNKGNARDAEIHQTKKGQQGHFWMKAHIGVDERMDRVHSEHNQHQPETTTAGILHGIPAVAFPQKKP